jgi:hypothetical protein
MRRKDEYDPEQSVPMMPVLLTIQQAADMCQVGIDRIREWSHEPGFPVIRSPQMVRIHAKLLEQWLERKAASANPEPDEELVA